MRWAYLISLVLSLGSMALIDHRWRLVLWADARRGLLVLGAAVVLFLAWDVVAIALGVYGRGDSAAMTGYEIARELPVEELFFIAFLSYLTLVLHHGAERLLAARGDRRGTRSAEQETAR